MYKNDFNDLWNSIDSKAIAKNQDEKNYVYPNQLQVNKEILNSFIEKNKRWVLLHAQTQTGKSGTMFNLAYLATRTNLSKILKIATLDDKLPNVWLLTGMNDRDLIDQLCSDFEAYTGISFGNHVLFNGAMQKYLKSKKQIDLNTLENLKNNALIFIDESHYGASINQTLDSFLNKINIDGKTGTGLIESNRYIISVSATPMAETAGDKKRKEKSNLNLRNQYNFADSIILEPGDNYIGFQNMIDTNRLYDSYSLNEDEGFYNFINKILLNNINKKEYGIVRINEKGDEINSKIKDECNKNNIQFIEWNSKTKKTYSSDYKININTLFLSKKPSQFILIIIKGMFRAGKQMDSSNICFIHENPGKTDTATQALAGRCTGYPKNTSKSVKIYTSKNKIEQQLEWINSKFSIDKIPGDSTNVIKISKKDGFNSIENMFECIELNNEETKYLNENSSNKIRIEFIKKLNKSKNLENFDYKYFGFASVYKSKENSTYKKYYEETLKNKSGFIQGIDKNDFEIGDKIINSVLSVEENTLLIMYLERIFKPEEIDINQKSIFSKYLN